MKRKASKFLSILLTLVMVIGMLPTVVLAAAPAEPTNVHWEGTVLKWNSVEDAVRYQATLWVDGHTLPAWEDHTEQCAFDFADWLLPGQSYAASVRAINANKEYSDFSEIVYCSVDGEVGTITGFQWNGNKLSWNDQSREEGYYYQVTCTDTTPHQQVDQGSLDKNVTELDLSRTLAENGAGTYYVSVSAFVGGVGNTLAEGESSEKTFTTVPTLITSVAITNVAAPVNGASSDVAPTGTLPSGANYTIESARWLEGNGQEMTAGEVFAASTNYMAEFTLAPKSGMFFPKTSSEIDAKINGAAAFQTICDEDGTVRVRVKFSVGAQTYTISATASPAEGGTITGIGVYEKYEYATLTATPNEGYKFVEWTENGSVYSRSNVLSGIWVDRDRAFVAVFEKEGGDTPVTPPEDDENIISSVKLSGFAIPAVGTSARDVDPTATVETGKGYAFSSGMWSDLDGNQFTGTFQPGETYTAKLYLKAAEGYEFADAANLSATVKDSDGAAVTVKKVSVGTGSRANDSATVTVTFTAGALKPVFTQQPVGGEAPYGGTKYVSWSTNFTPVKAVLVKGKIHPVDGEVRTYETLSATTTANVAPGYDFYAIRVYYSDSEFITSEKFYVTEGENTMYTITATASPAAGGTVTGAGTYAAGTMVHMNAYANSGYQFVEWRENDVQVSTNSSYTISGVTANHNLVAVFEEKVIADGFTLSVSASPAEGGIVFGGGIYEKYDFAEVTAIANPGYVFYQWTENGNYADNRNPYKPYMSADRTFVAEFNKLISNVAVTGFTVPEAGAYATSGDPVITIETAKGYTLLWTEWCTVDGDTYTGSFEDGETYYAQFKLQADDGYQFDEAFSATVNGSAAYSTRVSVGYRTNDVAYVMIKFTVGGGTPDTNTIDTVAISGITEPVKGAAPVFAATVPADAGYVIRDRDDGGYTDGVMWEGYYEKSNGEITNKYTMDADDTFLSGYTYVATVLVEPKDGYEFYYAEGSLDPTKPDVTATMNGEDATYNKDSTWLIVQRAFYVPMDVINHGFTQQPSGGEVYPGKELTVNWATDFTPTKIEIHTVVSASSYNLVKTLDGTATSTSLYANKFPYIVVAYYGTGTNEFKVSNPFTITEKELVEITAVEVNVAAPVAGNKPSYTASVPADAGYAVKMEYANYYTQGVMWEEVTETTREWTNAEFVEGHNYLFTVLLKPKDGYEFRRDVTEPDLDLKVNGISEGATCNFYDMGNDIIMVQYLFTATGSDTGVTVSGSAVSWNNTDDAVYLLYGSTVDDATIKAEWKDGTYATAGNVVYTATKGSITDTTVDGKAMKSQAFSFEGVASGTYKLAIFKPGKYVPKIVTITVGSSAVDAGQQKLWLYGDVNYDKTVNVLDAVQIQMYKAGKTSVFTEGTQQDITDRMTAANVTAATTGDAVVNVLDAVQIQMYKAGKTSAFDSMK